MCQLTTVKSEYVDRCMMLYVYPMLGYISPRQRLGYESRQATIRCDFVRVQKLHE